MNALQRAAEVEGAWLQLVRSVEARSGVIELVPEGNRVQWSARRWRAELAAWMQTPRKGEGLTVPAAPVSRIAVRLFDMGKRTAVMHRKLLEGSPLVAVLGTDRDRPTDWLHAGQALERILLRGAREGVQASYLNQPIQVAKLRPSLGQLLGARGFPQLRLRLGFEPEAIRPAPPPSGS